MGGARGADALSLAAASPYDVQDRAGADRASAPQAIRASLMPAYFFRVCFSSIIRRTTAP